MLTHVLVIDILETDISVLLLVLQVPDPGEDY